VVKLISAKPITWLAEKRYFKRGYENEQGLEALRENILHLPALQTCAETLALDDNNVIKNIFKKIAFINQYKERLKKKDGLPRMEKFYKTGLLKNFNDAVALRRLFQLFHQKDEYILTECVKKTEALRPTPIKVGFMAPLPQNNDFWRITRKNG
jgi:hypothetical protein